MVDRIWTVPFDLSRLLISDFLISFKSMAWQRIFYTLITENFQKLYRKVNFWFLLFWCHLELIVNSVYFVHLFLIICRDFREISKFFVRNQKSEFKDLPKTGYNLRFATPSDVNYWIYWNCFLKISIVFSLTIDLHLFQ
jgi:hypothetical protein